MQHRLAVVDENLSNAGISGQRQKSDQIEQPPGQHRHGFVVTQVQEGSKPKALGRLPVGRDGPGAFGPVGPRENLIGRWSRLCVVSIWEVVRLPGTGALRRLADDLI